MLPFLFSAGIPGSVSSAFCCCCLSKLELSRENEMLRSLGLKVVSPLRKSVFLLFGMHIVGPGELDIIKI